MSKSAILPGLIRTANERIVQNNSTAVGLNSTTLAAGGSYLRLSVETGDCRFLMGGTLTPTTGVLLQKDTIHIIEGFNNTALFKFIHNTGEAATVINVEKYKFEGEGL